MSEIKNRKVVLVGAGAVGTSFLYASTNRGVASNYQIIDLSEDVVDGNVMDIEDSIATSAIPFKIEKGSYAQCSDADVIVITAGRPQNPGETRLNMVEGNAKIMKMIATEIKKSGFNGITIIASNPVDVMTQVYQKVTGFETRKVIGSGTSLDSARLQIALAKEINVAPQSISAYVMGEHGDSSISAYSVATVNGMPLQKYVDANKLDDSKFPAIHESVWKKAYEIIQRKRATFYGIGSALANLTDAVLKDKNEVMAAGAFLEGQYGHEGVYVGVPVQIGSKGIIDIIELDLSDEEKAGFDSSVNTLKETIKKAEEAIA